MTTLLNLMNKSGLNRNQVSKISGISNTYLAKIERFEKDGARISIKRKTLINIAVSLNLSILEINDLLREYGHSEVSTSDTPYFLAASENQNVTGILPLFSSLALEWFLIGMEKQLSSTPGASLVFVLDQPSHSLKSPEYACYVRKPEHNPPVAAAYKDLVASACMHRRKLITEALEKGNIIRTYICADCLTRYMGRWKKYKGTDVEKRYKGFLRQHFETLIEFLEKYPQTYELKLLNKCPRIKYEMLYLPAPDQEAKTESRISKVFFHGQASDCNKDKRILGDIQYPGTGQGFGDLIGFASDLQTIVEFFHKQHEGLIENFTDHHFDEPSKLLAHLKSLVVKYIP